MRLQRSVVQYQLKGPRRIRLGTIPIIEGMIRNRSLVKRSLWWELGDKTGLTVSQVRHLVSLVRVPSKSACTNVAWPVVPDVAVCEEDDLVTVYISA